ncbi:MAG: purine-nucleoside phosphorylase [Microthrixaceae bacterium]
MSKKLRHAPFKVARRAANDLSEAFGQVDHSLAVWLGSGWRAATEQLDVVGRVGVADVAGFVPSGAMAHGDEVLSVALGGDHRPMRALVFTGRTHLYEGHGVPAVVHGIRTAAAAGCRVAVLTNAAGCLREGWGVGRPALIADQLNLTGHSPLTGPLGPPPHDQRHVDLTDAYHPYLRRLARSVAPDLPEGVYAGFHGPEFETPAEIAAVGQVGVDLVGQSTVLETIAARHVGMEVLGISLVTNVAAGLGGKLSAQEVVDVADAARNELALLLAGVLGALAADGELWRDVPTEGAATGTAS